MSAQGIAVEGLSKAYGGTEVVRDVSFRVPPGQVHGLIGPNGAGKTTTIRAVLGLSRPSRGSVRVNGVDPYLCREGLEVGALLEESAVYASLSALDNLVFVGRIRGCAAPGEEAQQFLERVGLARVGHALASTFSKGMRRKVGLARALLGRPRVLVFDEPTSGIAPDFQQDFRDLVRELAMDGRAILLSSHNLHEVQSLCDTITFLEEGRVVLACNVHEIAHRYRNRKYRLRVAGAAAVLEGTCRSVPDVGLLRNGGAQRPLTLLTERPLSGSEVSCRLCQHGLEAVDVEPAEVNLEDVYQIAAADWRRPS